MGGWSYEEVLPKVKAKHDALGVPFGHWQFDSWWAPEGRRGRGLHGERRRRGDELDRVTS